MRKVLSLLALLGLLSPTPAGASVVWSESTTQGFPVTNWTRGNDLSESMSNARAYAGGPIRVLMACRQSGWYAYVGSEGQFQRGVSCGYETKQAALFRARAECLQEGGRCDLERLGYDPKPAANENAKSDSSSPTSLPGGEANVPNFFQLGAIDLE